jgi:hypothetical protein
MQEWDQTKWRGFSFFRLTILGQLTIYGYRDVLQAHEQSKRSQRKGSVRPVHV